MNELTFEGETKEVVHDLRKRIESEGLTVSWTDPFFSWVNPSVNDGINAYNLEKKMFYVSNPPVPKIAPFDLAAIAISIDKSIYFSIKFYFSSVLENLLEAKEINDLFEQHDDIWFNQLVSYFSDIQMLFSLTWDIEHDIYIEDTLYGIFDFCDSEKVIALIKAIKDRNNKWAMQNSLS
jgi:hypothetical protein